MQNEINALKLSLANLIEEIKKQPDPYFEDLSTVLSLYTTIHKSEKEVVELFNKYIPQISKDELIKELLGSADNRGEEYIKFAPYLVEALAEYGGARKCQDVLPDIIARVGKDNKLASDDLSLVDAETEIRGYNRTRFMRNTLRKSGFILDPANGGKHGVWELTDKAKVWYEKWSQAI